MLVDELLLFLKDLLYQPLVLLAKLGLILLVLPFELLHTWHSITKLLWSSRGLRLLLLHLASPTSIRIHGSASLRRRRWAPTPVLCRLRLNLIPRVVGKPIILWWLRAAKVLS